MAALYGIRRNPTGSPAGASVPTARRNGSALSLKRFPRGSPTNDRLVSIYLLPELRPDSIPQSIHSFSYRSNQQITTDDEQAKNNMPRSRSKFSLFVFCI